LGSWLWDRDRFRWTWWHNQLKQSLRNGQFDAPVARFLIPGAHPHRTCIRAKSIPGYIERPARSIDVENLLVGKTHLIKSGPGHRAPANPRSPLLDLQFDIKRGRKRGAF